MICNLELKQAWRPLILIYIYIYVYKGEQLLPSMKRPRASGIRISCFHDNVPPCWLKRIEIIFTASEKGKKNFGLTVSVIRDLYSKGLIDLWKTNSSSNSGLISPDAYGAWISRFQGTPFCSHRAWKAFAPRAVRTLSPKYFGRVRERKGRHTVVRNH